jgi:hypothetical protein
MGMGADFFKLPPFVERLVSDQRPFGPQLWGLTPHWNTIFLFVLRTAFSGDRTVLSPDPWLDRDFGGGMRGNIWFSIQAIFKPGHFKRDAGCFYLKNSSLKMFSGMGLIPSSARW